MTAVDLGPSAGANPFLRGILADAARFRRSTPVIADDVAETLTGVLTVPMQVTRTSRFRCLGSADDLPQPIRAVDPRDVDAAGRARLADHQDQELEEFNVLLKLLREQLLLVDGQKLDTRCGCHRITSRS